MFSENNEGYRRGDGEEVIGYLIVMIMLIILFSATEKKDEE